MARAGRHLLDTTFSNTSFRVLDNANQHVSRLLVRTCGRRVSRRQPAVLALPACGMQRGGTRRHRPHLQTCWPVRPSGSVRAKGAAVRPAGSVRSTAHSPQAARRKVPQDRSIRTQTQPLRSRQGLLLDHGEPETRPRERRKLENPIRTDRSTGLLGRERLSCPKTRGSTNSKTVTWSMPKAKSSSHGRPST